MKLKNHLIYPIGTIAYPFGVETVSAMGTEVHGPFNTRGEAVSYQLWLANEYDDYHSIKIVKIETPEA